MNFSSDNAAGVSPEIMAALAEANQGPAMAYGNDPWTERLTDRLSDIFERRVAVFPVTTGTAANSLALSALCPPYGSVYCHTHAHIAEDECGAPEFYTGGAKLMLVAGGNGRIDVDVLATALRSGGRGNEHHVQPAAVSLTQATEAGTVYTPDQVAGIAAVAREHGLAVHMDGARFANALHFLDCSPADATWRAGVDVLSLGATKNGAMAAEAVVFFDPDRASDLRFRRKRAGHLSSKMRFVSAQLLAVVDDGLWLRNAARAHRLATELGAGLAAVPGIDVVHPVEANLVFARMPAAIVAALHDKGFLFHVRGGDDKRPLARLVTAFDTSLDDVGALVTAARQAVSR